MRDAVEIKQVVQNLNSDGTIWQGPHVLTWLEYPRLGFSILHSLMPVKK